MLGVLVTLIMRTIRFYLFMHSFVRSFVRSFVCSFVHSFIYQFIHLCLFTYFLDYCPGGVCTPDPGFPCPPGTLSCPHPEAFCDFGRTCCC